MTIHSYSYIVAAKTHSYVIILSTGNIAFAIEERMNVPFRQFII